jgi:hypothetical protein
MTIKNTNSITLILTILLACLSPTLTLFSGGSDFVPETIANTPSTLALNDTLPLLAEDFSIEWSEEGDYSIFIPLNHSLTPSSYILNLHWASFGDNTNDPGYKLDFLSENVSLGSTTLRDEMIDDFPHIHPFHLNLTSETTYFSLLITWNNPIYTREGELVLYSKSIWNKINVSDFSFNDSIILPDELSLSVSSDSYLTYSYASVLALILFEQPYCSFTLTFNLDLSYAYSFDWLKMDVYHSDILFHSQTIKEEGSNEISFQLDFPSSFLIFRIELSINGRGDFYIDLNDFYIVEIVEPEVEEANDLSVITNPIISDDSSSDLSDFVPSPTGSKFRQFLGGFNYSFQAFILHSGFFTFLFISIRLLKFLGYKKFDPDGNVTSSKGAFDEYLITHKADNVNPLDGIQKPSTSLASNPLKSVFPIPVKISKNISSNLVTYIFLLVYLFTFSSLLFYNYPIIESTLLAFIPSFLVFGIIHSICHKSKTVVFSMSDYFEELKGIISLQELNDYSSYSPVYTHPISVDGTYNLNFEILQTGTFLKAIFEFEVGEIDQNKLDLWDKKEVLELTGKILSVFNITKPCDNSKKICFTLTEKCSEEEANELYSNMTEIAEILIPLLYPVVSTIAPFLITEQEENSCNQDETAEKTSDSGDQEQNGIFSKSLFDDGTISQTATFDEIMEGVE